MCRPYGLALGVAECFMQPTTVDNTLIGVVLTIIAIVAVLTIVAILVGARKRRERVKAARIEQERLAETPPVPDRPLRDEDATDVPVTRQQIETSPPVVAPAPAVAPEPAPPAPEPAPTSVVRAPVASAPVAPPAPPLANLPEVAPAPAEAVIDELAQLAPSPLSDEPIAAAAPQEASPAAEAQAIPVARATTPPGAAPLTQIKGLGPKVAARLGELGITNVGELAALDQRAAEDLDAHLGPFTGRMSRDRWLEQARLLADGDIRAFEERFGKL
jgi:predicted flap endonuclease-1-like 5' DNA nuclease